MLYGTQWLRRRHLISFRVGTSIGRKEDMYVSTLVWTNHCLLRAGRRLEKLIHHCVAIWSPWTKVPKQGSAVGSSCPQTTLVSLLIHSLCLVFVGTLYTWLIATECVLFSMQLLRASSAVHRLGLALTLNPNMATHCAHPIYLPQTFCCQSSNSTLSDSWPTSQTLSYCTWIRI